MPVALTSLVPPALLAIVRGAPGLERSYLVGGAVRDWLLGATAEEWDVEVFGVSYDELAAALAPFGKTVLVGRSFGVVKLTTPAGESFDFTVPRRDSKVAPGHRGFEIALDPSIDLESAASRRDFTVNSMMYDPRRDELLDFFGGRDDVARRSLRHTSPAFVEDPLRVLRGMQLAARFELSVDAETIELCRQMKSSYCELAVERVRDEWIKWARLSTRPSLGLRFLVDSGWIEHFPEIAALSGTPQDPEWHPEGDVFTHTCHCCDALVEMDSWKAADRESRIVYSLAVLAHDFGKPETTHRALRHGAMRVVSPGHERAGGPIADAFLGRIGMPRSIRERVVPLVTNHLAHLNETTDRSVRRLSRRLEPENIDGLCLIMTADHYGRPPKPKEVPPAIAALAAKAEELQVRSRAPEPLLMGRHLLELGLEPGPQLGSILALAFDAQLAGEFVDLDQALAWLGTQSRVELPPSVRRKLIARRS